MVAGAGDGVNASTDGAFGGGTSNSIDGAEGGEGGTLFEPFNLAYTNTYLLRAGATGGLATYYAFASYQELHSL